MLIDPNSAVQARSPQKDVLLMLNAGSSSLKFAAFSADAKLECRLSGSVKRIGSPSAELSLNVGSARQSQPLAAPTHASCLGPILEKLESVINGGAVIAAGHRIVHGGARFVLPEIVSAAMVSELRSIVPLAPEHLPSEIELLESLSARFPAIPQIACFDTAFHAQLPRVARMLPLPRRFENAGVRRYGFHGLSYEFLMEELAREAGSDAARGRVILAHLGNGASMAAVLDGRGIDTSMAFTPAAGLVMGTRTGDLDPGLFAYLADTEHLTPAAFQKLVNHESGMLGVSGQTSDMQELLALENTAAHAAEAVALFCYQAKKWLGAYAAALGGLDTLVFAGGIGENCASVRARICAGLDFLGVELDAQRNAAHAPLISSASGRVAVRVIRTDEELMLARSVFRLLKGT